VTKIKIILVADSLTGLEWHTTGPKVTRLERHIDARKRDGSKTALQFYVPFQFLLLLGLLKARPDDVGKHFFDFLDGECFC
jgi:hypothetical protein